MEELWIEKYRPKKLSDVIGQADIMERLKAYVEARNLPHIIFAGPAGTGKTTSAIALARELFGDVWTQNFSELNASDERGIDVVRGRIKEFARTAPIGNVPFKIIFLDEADALTGDAQTALRRTMEKYSGACRFILSCNYSSKLIEPIQSRCTVFRFRPLKEPDVKKYIRRIAGAEDLKIADDAVDALIYIGGGDLRKITNSLQTAAAFSTTIDADSLYKITATARPEDVKKLMETALKGGFIEARNVLDELLITYGMSGEDVIKQVHSAVFDLTVPDEMKVRLVDKIGEIEFRMVEGSNERIQLEALLAHLCVVGKGLKG